MSKKSSHPFLVATIPLSLAPTASSFATPKLASGWEAPIKLEQTDEDPSRPRPFHLTASLTTVSGAAQVGATLQLSPSGHARWRTPWGHPIHEAYLVLPESGTPSLWSALMQMLNPDKPA
jgi:hypothetical protein